MEGEEGGNEPGASRLRLALIGAVIVGIVLVVIVVVLVSGDDTNEATSSSAEFVAADPDCLDAWNADSAQTTLGAHQVKDHEVEYARVVILGFDGEPVSDRNQGECVVIFPTQAFGELAEDPDHVAQIKNGDVGWQPVRELPAVIPERVAELRADAAEASNAALGPDGSLSPLSGP